MGKKSNLTSVSATPGEEDVDDDDDEHEEDGVVNEPIGSASDASAASAVVDLEGNKRVTLPGALESPVTTKDTSPTGAVGTMSQVAAISTETEIDRTADLLSFYERIVRERLRRSTYNTSTTSARLGAEIVGNSYADLKQALRVVHYLHFGMGSRGKIRSTRRMYQDLGLPAALQNDMLKARSFATDVHERRDVVDGVGAEAYIKTVDALVGRLCSWARNQLKA
ncbi:hypothetical protein [Clavibacter sp. B3I6]|uniref:hypothetical protein n=1 Tax=Clavibacter sp. B3I6 TaxID=3042268 RepID=UPI0027D7D335|nr:hypothetical protein [Clavibacter sp. B3I6]